MFPPGQCNKSIQSRETLTYLDLTFKPHLTLHIQKLPADLDINKYEVKQCFCSNCSVHDSHQDCKHIGTVEAGSENNDDVTLPIDIEEEDRNFFFKIYARSNLCEEGICYISRTQTLTSTFISMSTSNTTILEMIWRYWSCNRRLCHSSLLLCRNFFMWKFTSSMHSTIK